MRWPLPPAAPARPEIPDREWRTCRDWLAIQMAAATLHQADAMPGRAVCIHGIHDPQQ